MPEHSPSPGSERKLILPGLGAIGGMSVLCGVGFTMSLFIGSLAFEGAGPAYEGSERPGILMGSGVSAVLGHLILAKVLPRAGKA